MKAQRQNKLVSAILTLALGILIMYMKQGVVSIAMTVIAIALVVYAVLDILNKKLTLAIIKVLAAVAIGVLGWTLVEIAMYIIGALALVYGVLQLVSFFTSGGFKNRNILVVIFALIEPVVSVVAGVGLLLSQASTLGWIFTVVGILLIVDAVLALVQCIADK